VCNELDKSRLLLKAAEKEQVLQNKELKRKNKSLIKKAFEAQPFKELATPLKPPQVFIVSLPDIFIFSLPDIFMFC